MQVQVRITGDEQLLAHFGDTASRRRHFRVGMDLATAIIHRAVGINTPVGVTSILANSWATDTIEHWPFVMGIVATPIEYASVIEHGRTAGARMPPPDAIATWVERKLGPGVDPFVVARSIGRKGIEGRHMLERAVSETRPAWTGVIHAAVRRMVEGP